MIIVDIPEYIEREDIKTHRIMTFRFIKRVNNRLFLYENIKTGCKECFDWRELSEMKKRKKTLYN